MRVKKLLIFFILASTVFGRIVFELQTNLVQALPVTYQTDFNTATWVNRFGSNTTSTTGSPFSIHMNGHTFLMSYGTRDGTTAYFGSLNNNNATSYFRLDQNHLIASARILLAPFNPLGDDPYEMVVASTTTFYHLSLTSMTLAWESIAAQAFTAKVIYSLDQGVSWQPFGDSVTLSNATSPTSLPTSFNIHYTGIRLGYYFSVGTLTSTFHMKNPVLTIDYEPLSDEDAAHALRDEVILYTPCVTDEDNLVLLTEQKKQDLINKYDAMSANAKSIFHSLSIRDEVTAGQRYLFLIK